MAFVDGTEDSGYETQETEEPEAPGLSRQGQEFIGSIPEEHREIVGQYLPKWDKGFTQYAQRVQAQLKDYERFGTQEELQQAHNLRQTLLQDPAYLVEYIYNNREPLGIEWKWNAQTQQAEPVVTGEGADEIEQKLSKYIEPTHQKLSQFEKQMEQIAGYLQQQQQAQQQAREDAELRSQIAAAQKKHGDFDLRTVLSIARSNNLDIEQAVQVYNGVVERAVSARAAKQAPVVLGGQSLPQLQKTATDMSSDERRALMVKYIDNLNK